MTSAKSERQAAARAMFRSLGLCRCGKARETDSALCARCSSYSPAKKGRSFVGKQYEYRVLLGAIQRCHNESHPKYKTYGARGISVCDEWRCGPEGFARFFAEVGPCPQGYQIDRIDNDRGYEPGNVRWADRRTNVNNRRVTRMVTAYGETKPVSVWADETGICRDTILARLKYGFTPEQALMKADLRAMRRDHHEALR